MKKISLYIHIPFCIKKCGYCDFLSFEYDEDSQKTYIDYLVKEIKLYAHMYENRLVQTIFIGGGTPSLLSGQQMTLVMETIRDVFVLADDVEVSMESNPGTLNKDDLVAYREAGINRISMGVQTLENETLKSLDRIHDVQMVYDGMAMLKKVGFKNINMDLMFGLPGQTMKQLDHTVTEMIKLEPTHISAYSLKYEEGTEFYTKLKHGDIVEIEDEDDRAMYHRIIELLATHGFSQYEISNFSKPTYVCKHNMVYWEKDDYLGIGLGAHGCIENKRPYNVSEIQIYQNLLDQNILPVEGEEVIDLEEDVFETIILSLRLNTGLDLLKFNNKYDVDFLIKYHDIIETLLAEKLIEKNNTHIKLTALGRDLSNQVFIKFLS